MNPLCVCLNFIALHVQQHGTELLLVYPTKESSLSMPFSPCLSPPSFGLTPQYAQFDVNMRLVSSYSRLNSRAILSHRFLYILDFLEIAASSLDACLFNPDFRLKLNKPAAHPHELFPLSSWPFVISTSLPQSHTHLYLDLALVDLLPTIYSTAVNDPNFFPIISWRSNLAHPQLFVQPKVNPSVLTLVLLPQSQAHTHLKDPLYVLT